MAIAIDGHRRIFVLFNQSKQIDMNLQDLKNSRAEIISEIKLRFGDDKLKVVMEIMVDNVEISGDSYFDWEDILDEIEDMDLFTERKMKTADFCAALNIDKPFDLKEHYAKKH